MSLFHPAAPTFPKDGEILTDVAEIAKSAADEAAKISTEEAAKLAAEEAKEVAREQRRSLNNTPVPPQANTEMVVVATDEPDSVAQPTAPATQILVDALTLAISQQGSKAPSSSGTGEPTFDDEIARILAPFSQSATKADNAADNAADLAFLETMVAGFKDVQDRYSKR